MGMDIIGLKPKTKHGEYFRNNVWWWHPLWDYCCHIEPTLRQKVPHGHSNDGDGLNGTDARQLGLKLQQEINTGRTLAYVEQYEKERQNLPKQDCNYCDENGERQWQQENGETISKTCNACKGTKKVDPWESHYPMNLDNVQQFTQFLLECGGFQIC